jgi:PAS domain S-box-containing protein/putative nucleotidyltransferase with HDIG domain
MGIILVAYERESEQTALEQLLGSRGHQVLKAANGLAALEMARREPPHVVVSDIVLPRMDGFALCRKWKQDERLQSVPFIFYTRRHDDPKYERFALELGAERFLARTAQPEALATAVEQLLANVPAANAPVANPAAAAVDVAAVQRVAQQRTEQALASAQKKFDRVLAEAQQQAEQAQAQAIANLKAEHEQALSRAITKLQSEHQQALAQAERNAEQQLAAAKAEHERALAQAQQAHQQALEQSQQALERLRAEVEALEISRERVAAGEARFRRVFEANPLPMWITDHATHGFIAVNDAALALYGYSRAEFLALSASDLAAPAAEGVDADVAAHKQKSGKPLFVALSTQQLEFDGRSAELVCAYDLTARLERERTARASAQTTDIDSLGDGFLALNEEARIVDANVAYCRMTGYSREQLLEMSLSDVEQAGIGDTTARLQFVAMDGANRHETRHKRADGSLLDVEVSIGPVASDEQRPMTMLVRDVTQRRRELAAQRNQQRQLEFLVELFKHADGLDESAIVRRLVDHAALATDSPLGYLYFVDPARRTLTLATWRDRSQPQMTVSASEAMPLARAGVFTECVKARRATLSNDVNSKPQENGLPDVQRFVAVPMVDEDQTVAILGVANRDTDYGQDDAVALALLADGVWRILQAKRGHARTLSSLQRTDVALQGMIETLVRVGERHDPFTAGSSSRVAALAVAIAREAGLDGQRQDAIRVAALLHDIGNVAVPASILGKPGPLTEQEIALMRTHAEEGCKLLADIDFGAPIADIILEHHERIDGSGYPRALKGDDILIEARLLAIADTIEAMCSPRPYRPALGMEAALDEINKNAGKLYDLHLVAACTRLIRQRGFMLPG